MASLRDFWIETFQEEQQKAIDMFFEGNGVSDSLPTGYMENILYINRTTGKRMESFIKIKESYYDIHNINQDSIHER